jgi:hypothetical protein
METVQSSSLSYINPRRIKVAANKVEEEKSRVNHPHLRLPE